MGSKDVQIRAVRSDGQVFEYHGEDWGLVSVEGLDSPDIEIFGAIADTEMDPL